MKRTLIAAACALSLSAYALPTYEPFTEYASQLASSPVTQQVTSSANVPLGTNANSGITNCLDLATGGLVAPTGELWTPLYFSGPGGGSPTINLHGLDVAVISNSTVFTAANLASLLPSAFPGFPAVGGGITNIVENSAQPLLWNGTSFVNSNYCGNSAVLKFASDVVRPASGTKTIYVSYLFAITQQGQLATGNDGRYFAFLSSSNLSEGFTGGAPVPGAAYTNFQSFFNTFNGGTATGVHYASHGLLAGGSGTFIGPCDSAAGKTFAGAPFSTAFNNTPNFVVGAYVMNASGKDTNIIWLNPATSGFGGTTPPTSPIFATNLNNFTNMTDIGGICFIDRVGNGASGGVGTNYIGNLLIGSTWSYVTGGPEFTTQPVASASVNVGANQTLSAVATAAGQTVNYQWQKIVGGVPTTVNNGPGGAGGTATVTGANTGSMTLTGFGGGDVGVYQVVATASGTSFTLTSSQSTLMLSDPQITANPVNTTVNYGATATFTAQVSSTSPPVTYQWYKNGSPISNGLQPDGSTAANATGTTSGSSPFTLTLSLSGVSYQDDGNYMLTAVNSGNFQNSSTAATLTVNDPAITSQPTSPAVAAGGIANFTVGAVGSPTLSYQWFENGIQLSDNNPTATGSAIVTGSQTSTLTLTGVQDADDGAYSCTITSSGSGQSTNSVAAALTVQDALTVTIPPKSLIERVGDHTAFSVGVSGGGPSYQWYFGNTAIPGATGVGLTLANIQVASNGTYSVVVSNLLTSPITNSATLSVINSSILNLSPGSLVVARVGDGAQALSATTGNTVYLDQYTTGGGYQDTIQIPDEGTGQPYGTGSTSSSSMPTGSPAIIVAGAGADAPFEAMLSTSGNQEYLGLAGYCQAYPYTGINTVNTPNTTPSSWRGLATVNAFGTYNLAYTNSGLYSGGTAVIHDMYTLEGTNFWTTGGAGSGTVKFVNSTVASYAGGSGVPSSSGVSAAGGQVVQIVNGTLPPNGLSSIANLVVSDSGLGVNSGLYVAAGVPEPGAGNITFNPLLFTGGGQPEDFAFSPDNQTVYVAEGAAWSASGGAGTGGIERWDGNGAGGWSYSYTLPALPGGATNGAQGLTVDFSASATWGVGVTGAKIYATSTGAMENSLVAVVDNGSTSTPTVLATAGANQALRGVRFSPAVVLPTIVTAPLNQTNFPNNNVTFTVVATGSGPLTYQWSYNSTPITGATSTSFTTNNISINSGGNYSVEVINPVGQNTSATAVLTVTAGAPTISPSPLPNYAETVGDHLAWAPTVNGTLPVTNYWYFNSVASANLIQSNVSATGVASLVLTDIQTSSNGTYILVTSNQFGHAQASGTLTVSTSPEQLATANLVVARIGDGAQTLSAATGNTLYLDQYTTAGGYVNTIQIPDEGTGQPYGTGGASSTIMPFGSPALLFVGAGANADFEALMTLSPLGPDGQALTIAGYCEPYPFSGADLTVGANGGANWRGVADIDGYGAYTLAYTNTGLYSGGNHQIHGAVDIDGTGTNFYTTGQAGSGNGIKYVNVDFQPANGGGIAAVAGSFSGTRVGEIVSGNYVYTDGAGNPNGIYGVSGLPNTTATASLLLAETNSPVDFAVSPDGATVYIADNGTFTGTGHPVGGIQRWDGFPPASYTYSYTLATGASSTVGARGLTVDFSAHASWGAGVQGAKIYATTAEPSGNRLIAITDNGAASAATTITTAAANQILSGVRFGPATVKAVVNQSPQNESGFAGQNVTFSGQLNGSQPLTYQWYFQANCAGGFTMINGATNATLTVSNISSANVGCYEVTVTNPGGSATSTPATLTLDIPPHFTSETFLGLGTGGFQMSFTGTAGVGYTIWASTDATLAPIQSTWSRLTTGTFSGGIDTVTDPAGGQNPQEFYIISVP